MPIFFKTSVKILLIITACVFWITPFFFPLRLFQCKYEKHRDLDSRWCLTYNSTSLEGGEWSEMDIKAKQSLGRQRVALLVSHLSWSEIYHPWGNVSIAGDMLQGIRHRVCWAANATKPNITGFKGRGLQQEQELIHQHVKWRQRVLTELRVLLHAAWRSPPLHEVKQSKCPLFLYLQTFWPGSAEAQRHVLAGFAVSVSSSKNWSFEHNAKGMMCQALVFSHIRSPWVQSTHATPVLPPGISAAD